MSKIDFFGHFFYAALFMGMLLLQSKDYRGWAFRFAGEVGWIGLGFVMGMSSVWAWGFIFLVVDTMGFLKWQKEEQTQRKLCGCLPDGDCALCHDYLAEQMPVRERPMWDAGGTYMPGQIVMYTPQSETESHFEQEPPVVATPAIMREIARLKAAKKKVTKNATSPKAKRSSRKATNSKAKSSPTTSRNKKVQPVQRKVRKAVRRAR